MKKKTILIFAIAVLIVLLVASIAVIIAIQHMNFGFAREVSEEEATLRLTLVETAKNWLGANELDGSHKPIIDIYNAHEPLAVGYRVQYTDQWCATFGSTVAIQCNLTDIIPTECGCQRQIEIFQAMGRWEEDDAYIPLPGDYIFYRLDNREDGDCTKYSDHVGIVVGTNGDRILVIEGNFVGTVSYHIISVDDVTIRGYGLPDYACKTS